MGKRGILQSRPDYPMATGFCMVTFSSEEHKNEKWVADMIDIIHIVDSAGILSLCWLKWLKS